MNQHKHPEGMWWLAIGYGLFLYSYIELNTLLVLYAIHHLHMSTKFAYSLYGAFNALVFTSPLLGGYVSGKFGHKYGATIGVFISFIGACVLSLNSITGFYIGLAIYIVGYGICTPAYFCLVGLCYAKEDSRRESGYTSFYLIFNIGSLAASISGGYTAVYLGYRYAFILAAAGLFIQLLLFFFTQHRIQPHPGRSMEPQVKMRPAAISWSLIGIAIVASPIVIPLLRFPSANNTILWVLTIGAAAGVLWLSTTLRKRIARSKLRAYMILTISSLAFWALYMLEASLMTIFAEYNVNRHLFGTTIPPSVFYGLDPLGVILIGILFSWLWRYLSQRNRDLSLPAKFTSALISMGVGYLIFSLGLQFTNAAHLMSPWWIVLGYVFLTAAELLLSPIGLSMVGRLSPEGKEGTLMGVWTLYTGFGAVLSGYLAKLTVVNTTHPVITNPIYTKYFIVFGGISVGIGVILFFFISRIRKLIEIRQV